ncbi:MAG: gamma-glutamyltransferase family protein [Leptonema illini]|jgi:gamma-glutamyltranspeptidase/glutathione hydrolase|uniref:Gamma-glutamyltransferase family protein n=1 Tax=Leptonema illini TaxID=183 RepID=A0A833GY39_9LEPT|nr:MAG: gamma-glutamyltransferase family protein [Leptonema illini]
MKRIIKWSGIGLLTLILTLLAVYAMLPKGPRDPMPYIFTTKTEKPLLNVKEFAVVAGTPWASQAGYDVLAKGGTACDAAVATLLTLNVTHGEAASFPGVAPMLYYNAKTAEVKSYIAAGKAPAAATIERFKERGFETVPEMDLWSQLIPASPDVIISLLEECGTMSFAELSRPAIVVAREGFPAHPIIVRNLDFSLVERIGFSILMPENARIFIRGEWWRPVHLHDRMVFTDLANTLEELAQAESEALKKGASRKEALQAVRDYFYKGPIAEKITAYHKKEGGLITYDDLASYSGGWEKPVVGHIGDYTLYATGTWSQGIMESLVLQTLDGIDLKGMGHNSPAYIHTVTQAIDLAMADRDTYVGDAAFIDVPLERLLSREYAATRRAAMTDRAFAELPAAGQVKALSISQRLAGLSPAQSLLAMTDFSAGQDTSQLVIVDAKGNAVVMTPSDFPQTPMIPGTGLNLGNRMDQFRLDPTHVSALMPGKRPRITPHAVIVFKDGRFHMAFSTPGGDMQAQALVQVFLNMHVFGMDLAQAIAAPRFYSIAWPSSFAPHESSPAHIRLEADLYAPAAAGLRDLGYTPEEDPRWDKDFGAVGAIMVAADGKLIAGADPREETTALGR